MDFSVSGQRCPNCSGVHSKVFYRAPAVPVNSCLLFDDRDRAKALESGDVDLAFCPDCQFIYNSAWKPDQTTYSEQYEETQAFSETFNDYQKQQADELLARYNIVGKEIVEIGCGKGEFLSLLCALGDNRGVGYDPSFVPARRAAGSANIEFKREFFGPATTQPAPDLICCKMTLEHIGQTEAFARAVRRIASPERGTVAFIQVPDVRRILDEAAFWDVYYEHCSYFSPTSLQRVFRDAGFDILRMDTGYGDQYLTLEVRASDGNGARPANGADTEEDLEHSVARYATAVCASVDYWRSTIDSVSRSGGRTVLWGSGSKAVAFLAAVKPQAEIEYLVDINPYRWGKFVPGSGKQIVPPEFLSRYQPDLVIAVNPIYHREITQELQRHGCDKAVLRCLGGSVESQREVRTGNADAAMPALKML